MKPPTRSRRDHVAATLLAVAMLGAACAACGGDQPITGASTGPTCTPMPEQPVTLEGKAAAFDLSGLAEPIGVENLDGYLVINARSDGQISELVIEFLQVVTDAGFDIAGSEDDLTDAEVFFARGNVAAGQVLLTRSPCEGVVDVKIMVLDNPEVFPDESGTPPG